MARALSRASSGGLAGRATPRCSADDNGQAGRSGGDHDAGDDAGSSHPLELAADGKPAGPVANRNCAASGSGSERPSILSRDRREAVSFGARLIQRIANSGHYLHEHNKDPKPFFWTADADLILGKVQRLCERINNSGHQLSVPRNLPRPTASVQEIVRMKSTTYVSSRFSPC